MKTAIFSLATALIVALVILKIDTDRLHEAQTRVAIAASVDRSRYEFHSGEYGRIFVIDRQTGAAWRYYMTVDNNSNLTSEGFQQIQFMSFPAPASTPVFDASKYLASRPSPATVTPTP